MSHEERLPQCEAFQCEMKKVVDKHIDESGPFREKVAKHDSQVLTLEKAHEATMADIKSIQLDIKDIRKELGEIKVWILIAAVSGLMTLCGVSLWLGGDKKQIEVNTQRLNIIEEMHPRVSK